jgi:hypothetical protein
VVEKVLETVLAYQDRVELVAKEFVAILEQGAVKGLLELPQVAVAIQIPQILLAQQQAQAIETLVERVAVAAGTFQVMPEVAVAVEVAMSMAVAVAVVAVGPILVVVTVELVAEQPQQPEAVAAVEVVLITTAILQVVLLEMQGPVILVILLVARLEHLLT